MDAVGESSAQVTYVEVIPETSDNHVEGADDYVPESSFAVGKSPSQNGLSAVEMPTGTGGLGDGTPKVFQLTWIQNIFYVLSALISFLLLIEKVIQWVPNCLNIYSEFFIGFYHVFLRHFENMMNFLYDSCRARDPMTCFMMIYLENHLLEFVKWLVFCYFVLL